MFDRSNIKTSAWLLLLKIKRNKMTLIHVVGVGGGGGTMISLLTGYILHCLGHTS